MTNRMLHRASTSNGDLNYSPVEQLADRELEAFELIGRGKASREIAAQMHISPKTVDRYRETSKTNWISATATSGSGEPTLWVEENR